MHTYYINKYKGPVNFWSIVKRVTNEKGTKRKERGQAQSVKTTIAHIEKGYLYLKKRKELNRRGNL